MMLRMGYVRVKVHSYTEQAKTVRTVVTYKTKQGLQRIVRVVKIERRRGVLYLCSTTSKSAYILEFV